MTDPASGHLFAVIPEYEGGLDMKSAELEQDRDEAIGSAHLLQLDANEACIPVVFRVYALTEVER
jgi:hypothetical protein